MHSRNVEIKNPCHESWDAMHGDAARRFCDVCAKHVHNLSEMARDEAADLLQAHGGEHLCVRYSTHDDGRIAFRGESVVPVSRLRSVRTAFAAVMLAACAPHGDGPPIQDLGDVSIEVMARDAKPTPDGGCEVQTGPLTTLHFPAGHAVCKYVTDLGATIKGRPDPMPVMGAAPPIAEPPQPPPPQIEMGAIAPEPPRAKMGEMVPELKEPCDPQPGFAPPPPPAPEPTMGQAPVQFAPPPPEPPSRPRMGDVAVEPAPSPPRPKMGKMMIVDDGDL